jgi:hypothetical protein
MRFDTFECAPEGLSDVPVKQFRFVAIPDFTKTLGTLLVGLRSKTSGD